jgi:hypothetical protein
MSKLTDFYAHKAALNENSQSKEWEQLEDQLLKEELLPELMEQLKATLSKVKSPLMLSVCYDPNGCLSASFTRNCMQTSMVSPAPIVKQPGIEFEPNEVAEEIETHSESANNDDLEIETPTQKAKSIGFSVSFQDGTVFHEPKAVNTWILTLKKIGLENIYNNRSRLKAWHKVSRRDVCIVEQRQSFRRRDGKSPQKAIDGFFVMVQLSNESKVEDIEALSAAFPALGIKVTWDNDAQVSTQEETPKEPIVQDNSSHEDLPIKEQFRSYLARTKSEGTANSYTSTLDNAVRHFIKQKVDASADSVFSYTNSEEVSICIDMLNASMDFVAENDRKHHSMSAALKQYLLFIEEREKGAVL